MRGVRGPSVHACHLTEAIGIEKLGIMPDEKRSERISPLALGVTISGTLLAVFVFFGFELGRWEQLLAGGDFDALARVSSGILRDTRIAIVHCLIMGYLPAALLYVKRSGRRTVFRLQTALDCSAEECARLAGSIRLHPVGLGAFGLMGLVSGFGMPLLVPPVPEALWNPASWSPEVYWHRLLGPLVSVMQWWLAYAILTISVRLSRIARRLSRIDLLNLEPLAPFTQQGLTNALLLIGLLSLWSLMLLETGFGIVMAIVGIATLLLVVTAFLLPVLEVHQRIRQAKREELGGIDRAISDRRGLLMTDGRRPPGGELADLISYRCLISEVPEWPFTLSTYGRLFLYAVIPVVSWGLGVLVEEWIGSKLF